MSSRTHHRPAAHPSRTWSRLTGSRARWGVLLAVALVAAPGTALTALLFDDESDSDGFTRLDQPILDAVVDLRTPLLDRIVLVYSRLGDPAPAILATLLAVVGLSLLWRSATPLLLMFVAGAGSLAMSMTTKAYADRVRPPEQHLVGDLEPSWSFPSGHALNATIIAGVLAYLVVIRTRASWVAPVAIGAAVAHAVLMGLSRVYLGQHWASDVVVAWCMSAVWLTAVLTVHQLVLRYRERRAGSPHPGCG